MLKKMLCVLLALLTLCAPIALASSQCGVILTPAKSGCCNVRSGAGWQYGKIGWLDNGTAVEILSIGEEWDKIRTYDTGLVGYVRNTYITETVQITNVSKWGSVAYAVSKRETNDPLEVAQGKRLAVTGVLEETDKKGAIGHVGSWYEAQLIPTERTGYSYKVFLADGVTAKTNARVNLRAYDNRYAHILITLDPGEPITILKVGEEWSKVRYEEYSGFMHNKYIDLSVEQ